MSYLESCSTNKLLLADEVYTSRKVKIDPKFITLQVSVLTNSSGVLKVYHSHDGAYYDTYGDEINISSSVHRQFSIKGVYLYVEFKNTSEYEQIIREREFVANYKKQYASLPYPPIFSTADSVVIQSGHVLMIKRRAEPGKGLWALPGGYVNATTDKSVEDAAIRELREETMIKVPAPVLRGSIKRSKVFDAIGRSPRGRIITHAFHIELPDGELPKVKGNDDAEKARWVPISDVKSEECFEDHYEILQHFLGA
jgi:ADP-ribose pyrophosphatase YjhB (NUDIX family)